jgi:hypothetical protein
MGGWACCKIGRLAERWRAKEGLNLDLSTLPNLGRQARAFWANSTPIGESALAFACTISFVGRDRERDESRPRGPAGLQAAAQRIIRTPETTADTTHLLAANNGSSGSPSQEEHDEMRHCALLPCAWGLGLRVRLLLPTFKNSSTLPLRKRKNGASFDPSPRPRSSTVASTTSTRAAVRDYNNAHKRLCSGLSQTEAADDAAPAAGGWITDEEARPMLSWP